MQVKHPEVVVKLVGEDGNAYNLIGIVMKALRKAGIEKDEVNEFSEECFNSPSYDELLKTLMRWVTIE